MRRLVDLNAMELEKTRDPSFCTPSSPALIAIPAHVQTTPAPPHLFASESTSPTPMEEGEILQNFLPYRNPSSHEETVDISGAVHTPSIEWPEDPAPLSESSLVDDFNTPSDSSGSPSPSSSLRLLVQRSPVLRRHQKLALLDGHSEIQIGRDIAPTGSEIPRIRLKEMEVSKLHATIYWDFRLAHWAVVDMGSKHGTFVQSHTLAGPAAQGIGESGVRLSAPRVASMPRTIRHQDRLAIGGTTFIIHIHQDRTPCSDCSPQGDDEIPLFLHLMREGDVPASRKRKSDESAMEPAPRLRDPKKALAMLKRNMLSAQHHTSGQPKETPQPYVDRSARRRALYPDHSPARTPPANIPTCSTAPSTASSTTSTPLLPLSATSIASAPLSSSNVGHMLLMKQGWQPGTALGDPSSDKNNLVVPLQTPSTVGRAGIGAPVRGTSQSDAAAEGGDWKGVGKRRRWEELRANDGVQ